MALNQTDEKVYGAEYGSTIGPVFNVMQYGLVSLVFLFYFVLIVVKLCCGRKGQQEQK